MNARRGVTMMETVIGTLLVGGVLAGTLAVVGPTARATRLAGDAMIASYLATELLSEIELQAYEDPSGAARSLGPESGEANGTRSGFDDVDDYHGWSAPPQSAAGARTSGIGDEWNIAVEVVHVEPLAPNQASPTDTGVKRVTISVTKGGALLNEQSIVRTRAFDTAWGGD